MSSMKWRPFCLGLNVLNKYKLNYIPQIRRYIADLVHVYNIHSALAMGILQSCTKPSI